MKVVKVPNTVIAIIYRVLQLLIFAYIIGYGNVTSSSSSKGDFHLVTSSGTKKAIKNSKNPMARASSKSKDWRKSQRMHRHRICGTPLNTRSLHWYVHLSVDASIVIVLHQENNAFFIATRQIVTYDQTEGNCASVSDNGSSLSPCLSG